MLAEALVLIILPLLLIVAAGWDLASFTIPNFLTAALSLLFLVFAVAAGLSWAAIGWHLLAGAIGLSVGFLLFALGYVGGGDAKLFAAVTLWLGFGDLVSYALIASIFGGALTLAVLMARKWLIPVWLLRYGWVLRLLDKKSGIPYGVALAAGAFFLLPDTEIFRLAAGA